MVNKRQRVFAHLRQRIIEGDLPPGAPIKGAFTARRLGVSVTPVREALVQLQAAGFVNSTPDTGYTVRQATASDVLDLLQIRELIETRVARLVAETGAVPVLRAERDRVVQFLDHDIDSPDDVLEPKSLEKMHHTLIRSAGNLMLMELYEGVLDRIACIRNCHQDLFVERRTQQIAREHLAILDAIVRQDPHRAEQAMAMHLQAGWSLLGWRVRKM